jgi:hypothetical protein
VIVDSTVLGDGAFADTFRADLLLLTTNVLCSFFFVPLVANVGPFNDMAMNDLPMMNKCIEHHRWMQERSVNIEYLSQTHWTGEDEH